MVLRAPSLGITQLLRLELGKTLRPVTLADDGEKIVPNRPFRAERNSNS